MNVALIMHAALSESQVLQTHEQLDPDPAWTEGEGLCNHNVFGCGIFTNFHKYTYTWIRKLKKNAKTLDISQYHTL